ncbi:MAG: amino acid permease [Candidatus Bathyarchaeota archaeon]|nr:amino acid permease [Candidatus Bathyarchaeota archaeon]
MKKLEEKRKVGLFQAVMIGLGGAIGIEIFVLLNYATYLAGSTIVFALLVCGVINLLTMLSFSELGAAIPEVGGEYSYAKAALGGFLAFLTGWFRWISNVFGAALAALGFAYNILFFIQVDIPLLTPLIASIIIIVITVLSVRGVGQIGPVIVIAFIAFFILLIVGGFLHGLEFSFSYPSTFAGASGVFATVAYTFTMFLGMRAIAAGGPEIKDPGKNIPRAVMISAVVLIVLYCGIAYVTVSVLPLDKIEGSYTPLTLAAEQIFGEAGAIILTVAAIVAALSSLSTAIMVQSSIVRGLSRDGYLPKFFLSPHSRFKTPHITIIFGSIFYILFAATGVVEVIGYVAGFASILGFALVNLALIRLRTKSPYLKRPFKIPLYPYIPIAGFIISISLLFFIERSALLLGLIFILLGVLTYHLRMIGYQRIRIAFGGMSLGIGGFMALFAYLLATGYLLPISVPSQFSTTVSYGFIVICAISILAGVLNVTAKSER